MRKRATLLAEQHGSCCVRLLTSINYWNQYCNIRDLETSLCYIAGIDYKSVQFSMQLQGIRRPMAIRILKYSDLPLLAILEVIRATTLARLLHTAPDWWGYVLASDKARIQRFLNKTVRMGYLPPTRLPSATQFLLRRTAYCPPSFLILLMFSVHYSRLFYPVVLAFVNVLIPLTFLLKMTIITPTVFFTDYFCTSPPTRQGGHPVILLLVP